MNTKWARVVEKGRRDGDNAQFGRMESVPVGILWSRGSQDAHATQDRESRSIRTLRTPTPSCNDTSSTRTSSTTKTTTTVTLLPRTCAWIITYTCAYLSPPPLTVCVYHGTLADLSLSTMQEAGKRPNKKLPMGIVMGELDRRETVFFSFSFFFKNGGLLLVNLIRTSRVLWMHLPRKVYCWLLLRVIGIRCYLK